jgi:hypothetical protein
MNRKSNGLISVLILAGLGYLLLYLGVLPASVQVVLGVLVVCVLPGYLLSEIFFPLLKTTERLALSLGLSLVLVMLTGFALHMFGFGLVRDMWTAISFYGLVMALGIVALFRSTQHSLAEERRSLSLPKLHEPFLVLVAVGIAVAAVSIATGASQRQSTPVTQLWILPQSSANTVQVGVLSNERETFRLEITGDDEKLFDDLVVTLNGQAKVLPLTLTQPYAKLEATLYLPGSAVPYRRVVLW